MPLYRYQIINEDGTDGPVFEVYHRASEPPMEVHPETGERVKRLPPMVSVAGPNSDMKVNSTLKDNKKLESMGFTKYEKKGKGYMERTAGNFGPSSIGGGGD